MTASSKPIVAHTHHTLTPIRFLSKGLCSGFCSFIPTAFTTNRLQATTMTHTSSIKIYSILHYFLIWGEKTTTPQKAALNCSSVGDSLLHHLGTGVFLLQHPQLHKYRYLSSSCRWIRALQQKSNPILTSRNSSLKSE